MTPTRRWIRSTQVEGILFPLGYVGLAYGAFLLSGMIEEEFRVERMVLLGVAIFLVCNACVVFKLLFIDRVRILREREEIERGWLQ